MQLERLEFLEQECQRSLVDTTWAHAIEIYYRCDNAWVLRGSTVAVASTVVQDLAKCFQSKDVYHAPSSLHSFFPLPAMDDVVLRAKFASSPRKKTREAFAAKLAETFRHAENEFKVKHNPKTGLLAQDEFTERLQMLIAAREAANAEQPGVELDVTPTIAVVALDIDRFKQVNDDYGHLYGDLVIKAVALRLDQSAKQYTQLLNRPIKLHVSHFSGEEFWIAIAGAISSDDVSKLATHVRLAISEQNLPSDLELVTVASDPVYAGVNKPPERDRKITASLGCAVFLPSTSKGARAEASLLLQQADLALAKSKSTGRNCVTLFSEILGKMGRVLEFRDDQSVLVIDIGANVGVQRGQEFRVFHPDFSGATDFNYSDGRTTKKLGMYPRLEQCTIFVFAVQRDISFCKFSERTGPATSKVVVGSVLEAVPLGAFGYTIAEDAVPDFDAGLGLDIISGSRFQLLLSAERNTNRGWTVVVLRIRDAEDILEKYGNVTVNKALALLLQGVKLHLPSVKYVSQLEPTQLIVWSECLSTAQIATACLTLLAEAEAKAIPRVRFAGGACVAEATKEMGEVNSFRNHSVELARYAASEAAIRSGAFEVFDSDTPEKILSSWRERDPSKGLSDYKVFKSFGFESASLDNYAGLLASSTGDYEFSLGCYREADRRAPNTHAYRSNIAVALYNLGQRAEALSQFENIGADAMRRRGTGWATLVYSGLLLERYEAELTEANREQFMDVAAVALSKYDKAESRLRQRVLDAAQRLGVS
jgi:diguanylate cyclase (GGDEF)-like protein